MSELRERFDSSTPKILKMPLFVDRRMPGHTILPTSCGQKSMRFACEERMFVHTIGTALDWQLRQLQFESLSIYSPSVSSETARVLPDATASHGVVIAKPWPPYRWFAFIAGLQRDLICWLNTKSRIHTRFTTRLFCFSSTCVSSSPPVIVTTSMFGDSSAALAHWVLRRLYHRAMLGCIHASIWRFLSQAVPLMSLSGYSDVTVLHTFRIDPGNLGQCSSASRDSWQVDLAEQAQRTECAAQTPSGHFTDQGHLQMRMHAIVFPDKHAGCLHWDMPLHTSLWIPQYVLRRLYLTV